MKKEDKEKELIKLELEKIKIAHQNELEYITKKRWEYTYLVTLVLIALFTVFANLLKGKSNTLGWFTVIFLAYFLIFIFANDWQIDKNFYGKPHSFTAWIIYIVFPIWLVDLLIRVCCKKKPKAIFGKYEKEIDMLIKRLNKL